MVCYNLEHNLEQPSIEEQLKITEEEIQNEDLIDIIFQSISQDNFYVQIINNEIIILINNF